jgi:hypothetical protein
VFLQSWQEFSGLYECRGTKLLSGRELVPVLDVVNGLWRGRGISITDLSWLQEQKQKP